MLDFISGGPLDLGQVIGGGPEYFSYQIDPASPHALREALDLIIRAWTEPGPFEHYGEHFKLRYVNPWPKPLQKPHPPIWIPGAGSLETIGVRRERRYAYMGVPYFHIDFFQRNFATFRECCQKEGYHGPPRADGSADPDLRGRDGREGARGVRAALLVLPAQADPGAHALAAGLHVDALGAANHQGARRRQIVPHWLRDVGRRREGHLRDRREPGDRRREDHRARERDRLRQPARPLPAREHALGEGARKCAAFRRVRDAARERGAAEQSHSDARGDPVSAGAASHAQRRDPRRSARAQDPGVPRRKREAAAVSAQRRWRGDLATAPDGSRGEIRAACASASGLPRERGHRADPRHRRLRLPLSRVPRRDGLEVGRRGRRLARRLDRRRARGALPGAGLEARARRFRRHLDQGASRSRTSSRSTAAIPRSSSSCSSTT